MSKIKFKYIYGPVSSWRLGKSLGVDPVSSELGKTCNFDCLYCQVGKTKKICSKRKVFVKTSDIIDEIQKLKNIKVDYITFSGAGEPTLALNLGEVIQEIKKIKKNTKIAVITNASIIDRKDVRRDLMFSDMVMLKLDAPSEKILNVMNKPERSIKLKNIIKGIKKFRSEYKNEFTIQTMFTDKNKLYAGEIAKIAVSVKPDEIYINTPLRSSSEKPLSKKELSKITKEFKSKNIYDIKVTSVYDVKKKNVKPLSGILALKKRGRA
jgi:wyosine [tRNA(Phe)-imidazoG37] synthetase (radical SAM superfamily)